jgi:hypothetical protein
MLRFMNIFNFQLTNSLGNRILEMQKDLLNKEIKNILYGFADCLMYKTGQVGCEKNVNEKTTFESSVVVIAGTSLLHGQILGIPRLPSPFPIPIMQGLSLHFFLPDNKVSFKKIIVTWRKNVLQICF